MDSMLFLIVGGLLVSLVNTGLNWDRVPVAQVGWVLISIGLVIMLFAKF